MPVSSLSATTPDPVQSKGSPIAKVLKWKDGKAAVFLLEFDDSAPSAVKLVIPELKRRGMTGAFYINPGNPPYNSLKKEWETQIGPGIEYANHTFTHVGATSAEQLDKELSQCNDVIRKCYPDRKFPRLISFGQPGGVPWTVTRPQVDEALLKYSLIERPAFHGYPFQIKTQEGLLAYVDQALASGEMEHLDFHGVGGDWLVTPFKMFTALLDKLEANRDRLWITDPISWHQYKTEREGSKIETISASADRIELELTCRADPALYDLPLTLAVSLPSDWKGCEASQGGRPATVQIANGEARFSAVPGKERILLRPVHVR